MENALSPLEIEISNRQQAMPVDQRQLTRTVTLLLQRLHVDHAAVSIALIDGQQMRALKLKYLGLDASTDVMSFDLRDRQLDNNGGIATLDCEVVVNADRAAACADADAELNLYVVHGLLHQLGYDDRTARQARIMHEKEDQLLDELGFGRTYSAKG